MPEKVKVIGNTEEEKDVEQIAQAISRFLKNYELSIEKGEYGYDIYFLDSDQKEYIVAYVVPEKDKTTGDPYYETFLFLRKPEMIKEMIPKDPVSQFFTWPDLMSPIVEKMKSYLENFEITHSEVSEIVPSFILYLKKQPHA